MAFRGRGRGRGYGGGYGRGIKQEQFVLFPDIELPKIPTLTEEQRSLGREQRRLENFWKTSSYFLEESASKESIFSDRFDKRKQSDDIERYSDRKRPNNKIVRDSLSQYLVVSRFPQELVEDLKGQRPRKKKARWNLDSELNKLDVLEKLEQMAEGGEEDKKGDGDEDENEEEVIEAESSDTDGEYTQNIDFDDDEDDFIDADNDGGDEEGIY
ncbi:hypothetical protein FH972_015335 [Carpinus fangiana]|uniref:Uncharacterized protein n=1 Tax=Carpinus fangiana TaxID=176857 RepID=A0A5N6RG06_9ROSI|nr:hypothetical protein FH972_015335 [Carpinus fangiana]